MQKHSVTALYPTQGTINNIELDEPVNELNELEKLAGIGKQDQYELSISSSSESYDERNDATQAAGLNDSQRPLSAGAESSYSEFIQQWKNKLFVEDQEGGNGPEQIDDAASNHSGARSNYSRTSKTGSDSPFLQISKN